MKLYQIYGILTLSEVQALQEITRWFKWFVNGFDNSISAVDSAEERVFWFSSDDSEIKAIGLSDDFTRNSVQRIIRNGMHYA